MLNKPVESECLWADDLMRVVRDNKDSDREVAWDAFGKIYQKYKSLLWTLCSYYCGDGVNADLVYEATWEKIWNSPKYDYKQYKGSFKVWLAKMAKWAWLDVRAKSVLGTDAEIPDIPVEPKDLELVEEHVPLNVNEILLEEALRQLSDKEYDILMTYLEYDTDQKKHIPDSVLAVLLTKYQTTPANLRQIKCRALKKVKDYIEKRR